MSCCQTIHHPCSEKSHITFTWFLPQKKKKNRGKGLHSHILHVLFVYPACLVLLTLVTLMVGIRLVNKLNLKDSPLLFMCKGHLKLECRKACWYEVDGAWHITYFNINKILSTNICKKGEYLFRFTYNKWNLKALSGHDWMLKRKKIVRKDNPKWILMFLYVW